MTPRIGIIVFARMSSSRLPGKMLLELGGKSLLERVIERARCVDSKVVLATSGNVEDDALVNAASAIDVPVVRGSLDDVMGRAVQAAGEHSFDAFARLCGDRPLFPIDDMRRGTSVMLESIEQGRPADLISTHTPEPVPAGLTTEIILTAALARAHANTNVPEEREHVTTHFYRNRHNFRIVDLATTMRKFHGLHFSIDRPEDAALINQVFQQDPDIKLPVERAAAKLAGNEPKISD